MISAPTLLVPRVSAPCRDIWVPLMMSAQIIKISESTLLSHSCHRAASWAPHGCPLAAIWYHVDGCPVAAIWRPMAATRGRHMDVTQLRHMCEKQLQL